MPACPIAELARTRHTCKAFDPRRKIPDERIGQLRELLRNTPSSVNSQPWHFVVAASDAGKARIARATQGAYAFNERKILDASHVIVLCVRGDLDAPHLAALLDQEERDGRLPTAEARATQSRTREFFVAQHRDERKDLRPWMERQVFIALGALLLGAAALGIDACPIEGFDAPTLDDELGLRDRNLGSLVLVALGYRAAEDFNAAQPKSRLAEPAIFSEL